MNGGDPFLSGRLARAVDDRPIDVDAALKRVLGRAGANSGRRLAAALTALVVAGAAIGLVLWTFTKSRESPPAGFPRTGELLFVRHSAGGPPEIWAMRPDGSRLRRITVGEAPAWSPDGKRIAYRVVDRGARTTRIEVADAHLTHRTTIATVGTVGADDARAGRPAWSPDGRWLAFAGRGGIFLATSDGSRLSLTITKTGCAETMPSWVMPFQITFVRFCNGDGRGIWAATSDGADPHLLFDRYARHFDYAYPTWSPDGLRLAFTATRSAGALVPHVWTVAPYGDTRPPRRLGAGVSPTWSPDGRWIGYTGLDPTGHAVGIRVVSLASGKSFAVGPADGTDAVWSPAEAEATQSPPASPSPSPEGALGTSLSHPSVGPVAIAFGSAWVPAGLWLERVDLATGRVTANIRVVGADEVAVGGGAVWVLGRRGVVTRIDPSSNRVAATIRVGRVGSYSAIGVSRTAIWVLGRSIYRIDPGTDSVVARIPAPRYAGAIAAGGRDYVWVLADAYVLQRIDTRTNRLVRPSIVIGDRDSIAVGLGALWVASQSTGYLTKIDARTGRILDTIGLCGENVASGGACSVFVGGGRAWVYKTQAGSEEVWIWSVDPETGQYHRISVPPETNLEAVGAGYLCWSGGGYSFLYRLPLRS
jgi:hypothetical protein